MWVIVIIKRNSRKPSCDDDLRLFHLSVPALIPIGSHCVPMGINTCVSPLFMLGYRSEKLEETAKAKKKALKMAKRPRRNFP